MITKLDFIGVPSQDAERSRTLLRRHARPAARTRTADFEFWVGETCFGIWEPEQMGMQFAPQNNAHPALARR